MEAQRLNDLLRSEELELGFRPTWLIQDLWRVKNQAHVIRLLKGLVTARAEEKAPQQVTFRAWVTRELESETGRLGESGWQSLWAKQQQGSVHLVGAGGGGIYRFHPVVAL